MPPSIESARDESADRSPVSRPARGWRKARLTAVSLTSILLSMALAGCGPSLVELAGASSPAPAACPGTSGTADNPTSTLLGINATSPSQLGTRSAQFGHIPILRIYYTGMPDPGLWTTGVQGLNHSAVVVSFRSPPSVVLSGADDAALAKFFNSAPTGNPIYYSYYHEPELLVQDNSFTVDQYKAAWAHIVAIADGAHNSDLKSTLILMSWDLNPASGINWKDYLPSGHVISVLAWDAYPAGTVHDSNPQPTPPADFMGAAEAASKSVGLPYGFAEFALGTATDRPQWLAEVASYLRQTGALFGTLFDSTGYPWMELTDDASIQAWRSVLDCTTPTPPSSDPSPAPTVSLASVDPTAFVPTGHNHVRILFKLGQPAKVVIQVLNSQGILEREIDQPSQAAGWRAPWYFGYGASGRLLPAGTYTVSIMASNSAGVGSAQTNLTIGSGG
jgi:hypothetical protein